MAISDYWVYQRRNVATPWALYIVKEYDKRSTKATCIDFTLYHEDLPEPRSKSFVGLKHSDVAGYLDDMCAKMSEYVTVTDDDKTQIRHQLNMILR